MLAKRDTLTINELITIQLQPNHKEESLWLKLGSNPKKMMKQIKSDRKREYF
jgi:hypothetical protein